MRNVTAPPAESEDVPASVVGLLPEHPANMATYKIGTAILVTRVTPLFVRCTSVGEIHERVIPHLEHGGLAAASQACLYEHDGPGQTDELDSTSALRELDGDREIVPVDADAAALRGLEQHLIEARAIDRSGLSPDTIECDERDGRGVVHEVRVVGRLLAPRVLERGRKALRSGIAG